MDPTAAHTLRANFCLLYSIKNTLGNYKSQEKILNKWLSNEINCASAASQTSTCTDTNKAHIVTPVKFLYQSNTQLNVIFSTCVTQVTLHTLFSEQGASCAGLWCSVTQVPPVHTHGLPAAIPAPHQSLWSSSIHISV